MHEKKHGHEKKAKLKFDTNFLMNKIISREKNLIVKKLLMIKFYWFKIYLMIILISNWKYELS